MFRQSRMNQSRLPRRTTAVYSQGDRQHQSLATPAPYILPSDICELHTETSHISPCHVTPSPLPTLSITMHVSQGYNTQYALAPLTFVFATCL